MILMKFHMTPGFELSLKYGSCINSGVSLFLYLCLADMEGWV